MLTDLIFNIRTAWQWIQYPVRSVARRAAHSLRNKKPRYRYPPDPSNLENAWLHPNMMPASEFDASNTRWTFRSHWRWHPNLKRELINPESAMYVAYPSFDLDRDLLPDDSTSYLDLNPQITYAIVWNKTRQYPRYHSMFISNDERADYMDVLTQPTPFRDIRARVIDRLDLR